MNDLVDIVNRHDASCPAYEADGECNCGSDQAVEELGELHHSHRTLIAHHKEHHIGDRTMQLCDERDQALVLLRKMEFIAGRDVNECPFCGLYQRHRLDCDLNNFIKNFPTSEEEHK